MMIKICGITRREDALDAADAGASAIGFIFYHKSPRYVTPEKAAVIGEGITALKVGVFVDETPASIESVMGAAKLDVAQIYGGSVSAGTRVWRAFRMPVESYDIVESVMELEEAGVSRMRTPFCWTGLATAPHSTGNSRAVCVML